ncbi:uncharacterized protein PV06_07217 [Exophiala oligosperma]|uniref:Integral membrane protein n=1 Tax=Exophiala oligosperma TaxID=215243 RepID=A0A0D2BW49_9EURO|nr:uncharacterized protein PV06_07217 [Exophiala oligosperma]KIW41682.1 hypothetical protein PV06_07217 [Exophiala oligosperma]
MTKAQLVDNIDLTAIKPLLRAYALGYITVTGPRLFTFARNLKQKDVPLHEHLATLCKILKTSAEFNRLPTAVAIIVGGATALPRLVHICLNWPVPVSQRTHARQPSNKYSTWIQFISSLVSAWVAFDLLNRDESWVRKRAKSRTAITSTSTNIHDATILFESPNQHHIPPPSYHPHYSGKTIDFTLFAFSRALDIAVITAWTQTRSKPWHPEHRHPSLATAVRKLMDPAIFATSAAVIMWSWFYSPERLPREYNRWISKAADIDPRVIQALRLARRGEFVYGKDTGKAPLLQSLSRELGLPEVYGDPARTIPVPCELYHCGTGKSCERHAASRFWRSWKFAMEVYVPLQLLAHLRHPSFNAAMKSIKGAARSSSFLAAFVALFYYAVCLARTRLGPKVFSYKTISPQMWDSGLCILAGCLACGWSILLERPSRRQEIAFFVAPRALATVLPRVYDKKHQRREQAVFATSVAVVLTTMKTGNNGRSVRGVLGRLLNHVMKE